jgi:tripeptidyl-peptidase II
VTFPSPSVKCFTFAVQGGLTLELAIAQFWSSGMGSHEATTVDFEVNLSPCLWRIKRK